MASERASQLESEISSQGTNDRVNERTGIRASDKASNRASTNAASTAARMQADIAALTLQRADLIRQYEAAAGAQVKSNGRQVESKSSQMDPKGSQADPKTSEVASNSQQTDFKEPSSNETTAEASQRQEESLAAARATLAEHIRLLREYNSVRDLGRGLLGLVAEQRGVGTREVEEEFGARDVE